MNDQRNILLVAYGGGHVAALLPLARRLLHLKYSFKFLALTTAKVALDEAGIPSIGFRDFPDAADSMVQKYGHKLSRDLIENQLIDSCETVAYLGINYRDLVRKYGKEEAANKYDAMGRQCFSPIYAMESFIRLLNPRMIVTTNAPRTELAAILAAGKLGIPSVCVVDLFAHHEIAWMGQSGYADRICVLNNSVRELFISHGRSSDEVVVTGNPAFDVLNNKINLVKGKELKTARGWNDGATTILWAAQVEPAIHPFDGTPGDPELPNKIEQALRDFVLNHKDFRLVIRYHPSQNIEWASGLRVEFSSSVEALEPLLHAVDIVIVMSSTVGLQAHIAGKPVISVDKSMFTKDMPYSKMGISYGVDRIEDLPKVILYVLSQKGASISASKEYVSNQNATDKVMDVVFDLLGE